MRPDRTPTSHFTHPLPGPPTSTRPAPASPGATSPGGVRPWVSGPGGSGNHQARFVARPGSSPGPQGLCQTRSGQRSVEGRGGAGGCPRVDQVSCHRGDPGPEPLHRGGHERRGHRPAEPTVARAVQQQQVVCFELAQQGFGARVTPVAGGGGSDAPRMRKPLDDHAWSRAGWQEMGTEVRDHYAEGRSVGGVSGSVGSPRARVRREASRPVSRMLASCQARAMPTARSAITR